jgi:ribonuclease HI
LTTNQRMEIQAALEALRALPDEPIDVVSDSTYVVNCFRDRWWEGWLARGWLNKARKPIANRDLWEPLIELVRATPGRVEFYWVKGHGSDPMNDLVDQLAVEAAARQEGRSGVGVPSRPAASDPRRTGPPVPAGHLVVIGGLRPPGLGGYEGGEVADRVRRRLREILEAERTLHPDLVVLTGLGLGTEQLAAEAAAEAGVPYVAVLAYPDPDAVWPAAARPRFRQLLAGAAGAVVLQTKAPQSKQAAGGALARRDAWLARSASEAIVVWDGTDPAVGRLVRSLEDRLGEEYVWVVNPDA